MDLSFRDFLALLASYKRRIAGSYRLLGREDLGSLSPGAIVSPKIDGELWFLVLSAEKSFLANPRGRVIDQEMPVLSGLKPAAGTTIIAGELHARVEGRRCRVGDLASLFEGGEVTEPDRLCFAAFDLLPEPDQPAPPYAERLARLRELIASTPQRWVVVTFEDVAPDALPTLYDTHVASGNHEGLIVRTRDGMIYKVKPSHTIDAVMLGYTVKADQADGVRSLLLGLVHEDNSVQVLGACGNVGSDDDRKSLLARLAPLKADSVSEPAHVR